VHNLKIFERLNQSYFMDEVYLLTGGNIGDRQLNLQRAYDLISSRIGLIAGKSAIYETAAWGLTDQAPFLNQVLCMTTNVDPQQLLQQLLQIEHELGRERVEKMGPRIIDIDILFYGNTIIQSPDLIVPHPRIAERRFVLTPLHEIAPHFIHPVLHKSITELLQTCPDPLAVKPYASQP
jgi:2-amino-4-hydroxy-6-hydroxymethyldihydropteridine diphosphokinase